MTMPRTRTEAIMELVRSLHSSMTLNANGIRAKIEQEVAALETDLYQANTVIEAARELRDDLRGRMADGERFNPGLLTALNALDAALANTSGETHERP